MTTAMADRGVTTSPKALALAYLEACGRKDFERVAELLRPDVRFDMPGLTLHGVQDYVAALRRLAPIILRYDVRETIVDGNDVCAVYDFVTDTAVGAVPSAEWLTVEAGRIGSVRLIFDKSRWPEVLEELRRRASRAA